MFSFVLSTLSVTCNVRSILIRIRRDPIYIRSRGRLIARARGHRAHSTLVSESEEINVVLERRFEQCPGNRKRLLPSRFLDLACSFWARWRARRTEVLIEGSSGSSGGLVGEHQPDEPMRDGGRRAGRNWP